ncbi:MAG TPA: AAA family ATPase [Gemmatimonadales bacterium]|nr:AAA family ATPase [Gemmatimonadales bacterium]
MPTPRAIHCRVLGPVRITIDGADAPPELLWRKHLALLVYLARSPRRGRTREHLVGLLWSDRDERQARHSLSEALRVLRRALGEERVEADVDQVRLAGDGLVLDCDEFAARRAQGDWIGAAALAQGEFLEGLAVEGANEFENWLATERAAWRTQTVDALVRAAEAHLAASAPPDAAAAAQRALGIDAAYEPAARAVMRALALAGDRAGALRAAAAITGALAEQLSAKPTAETERLIGRIQDVRAGRRVPAAPPAARPRPPLIGRRDESAALAAAWAGALAGRGQVVLIDGEPGEGKTRLVDELVSRLRLEDATVACARAVPADQERPWSGIAGLLAAGVTDAPGLAGAPPGALAALAVLEPDLAARHSPAITPLPLPQAVSAAVAAAAEERPVLLAIDDAQWLDGVTLGALPGLARDTARSRVLLVLAIARGAPGAERCDPLRARIGRDLEGGVVRLGRFDAAALHALVRWALPRYGRDEVDRLARRIERDTAGIPLLAVAMAEAVAHGFELTPDAPAWPAPQRTLLDSLPGDLAPAVVGAVCLRYRGLSAPAQQVLAAAAAGGERVELGGLVSATDLDGAAVERALDELEWERWLAVDVRGYVLAAPIVREILLTEMITPGQARRYRERLRP